MEIKTFKTRIDWWTAIILIIVGVIMPLVFVLGIILEWFTGADAVIMGITAGFTAALVIAVFALCYIATYYELNEQGLITRNIFFKKKKISYNKIVSIKESVNIINRPKTWTAPLSVVGVRVDYIKEDGTNSWFFIAPKNRQEFMRLLQSRISS